MAKAKPAQTAEESLSPRETAELLGLSLKATQQHLARGAFPNAQRDIDTVKKRTRRVWIPITDIRTFAKRQRIPLPEEIDPLALRQPRNGGLSGPARRVLEELQREILDLRLRLAEQDEEIASLSGKPPK